jgi:ketosteroid isomerase-like protein
MGSSSDLGAASPEDVETIWALEQVYITAHRNADHQSVLSLWDDRFLGWPSPLHGTTGKEGGPKYLAEYAAEPSQRSFRIERQGIRLVGDVAINHYRLHWWVGQEDAPLSSGTTRLTHTWIRDRGVWRILGGMECPERSSVPE